MDEYLSSSDEGILLASSMKTRVYIVFNKCTKSMKESIKVIDNDVQT